MNRLIAWFARNGVAANLIMITLLAGGLLTMGRIKKEVFPEISADLISVSVAYPGATPEDTEEGICVKIEEAIQGLDGIERITSTSSEGRGEVNVEVKEGADIRKVLDDVKSEVDAIDTFPEEAEEPVVREVTWRRQVINVAVSGNAGELTLKKIGERVRDDLAALPEVSLVRLVNARPYEISIEISEDALRRYGLRFDDVADAVRNSSRDIPGGAVKTRGGEILLRTKGQAYHGREFENLVLLTRPDGTRLTLGDVARVVDGFAETDQRADFDGRPSVLVQVFRVGDQSALQISAAIRNYVATEQARLPEGIQLTVWQDEVNYMKSRMDLMLRNARIGFVLVFLLLALFLQFRLALWVSLGIPVSFLGALWVMPGLDVSISIISMFGFIVVLGIVVDDAIVVGENIHTYQKRGEHGVRGAIAGAQEVAIPVIFAVLTTVAAFAPLLGVPGNMGKFMRVIPLIVIPTLLFSLTESMLVLPAHLSHEPRGKRHGLLGRIGRRWDRFQGGFAGGLEWFIQHVYRAALDFGLRWRYLTLSVGLGTLLVTAGLVFGGWIHFVFFPDVEADNVAAMLAMPLGTPASVTATGIQQLENAALKLQEELQGTAGEKRSGAIEHILASVGSQPYRTTLAQNAGNPSEVFAAPHLGEVHLELAPSEVRSVSSTEIARRWREMAGPVPGAAELTFTSSLVSTGDDVNVQFSGPDLEELKTLAATLKRKLAEFPGVEDIADSFREGKEEIQLQVKPAAEAQGITLTALGRQVRQAFYGEEAQRVQRGRDEIKVMVRYPASERRSLSNVEEMRIRTPDGMEIPFPQVAEARIGRGSSTIRRVDRNRAVSVTAGVDNAVTTAGEVLDALKARVLPDLLAGHPEVRATFEGQQREQRRSVAGLKRGFLLALLAIFAMLAIPFGSYIQPLIVMSAIPFGLVGAIWGHILLGYNLTIVSMFGIVALSGVVVNDSLVLVDYINRFRKKGGRLLDAVREAGVVRFRPILLTSLTTFAGLSPLLMEKSVQAQFLIPMAISLAFGILFSTFITLAIVPASYLILEDVRNGFRKLYGRG